MFAVIGCAGLSGIESTFLCRGLKFPQALPVSWLLLHFEVQCIPNFSEIGSFGGLACKEFLNSVGHSHLAKFLRKGSPAGKISSQEEDTEDWDVSPLWKYWRMPQQGDWYSTKYEAASK